MSELICTLDALKAACRRATQEMAAMRAASLERLVFSREALQATAPHVRAGAAPWPQDVSWNRPPKSAERRPNWATMRTPECDGVGRNRPNR